MKVLIKNIQLEKEFPKVRSLETCSEQTLREIARKYQIGTQKRVKVNRDIELYGERKTQSAIKFVNKTRTELITAIKGRTKIVIDIPREYWSDEQYETFVNEGILENMDVNVEIEFKERIGVYKDLMPFEDLPRHKQDAMFIEVSMDVWEYLSQELNYKYEKDKNGLRAKRWRPLIYPHEFIPDTEEEKETVEKMNKIINGPGGDVLKLNNALKLVGDVTETTEEDSE